MHQGPLSARELLETPRLTPMLPLLYFAWEDGELTAAELGALREATQALPWLEAPEQAVLQRWLDPSHPPAAPALAQLRERLQHAGRDTAHQGAESLAALGLRLARAAGALPSADESALLAALAPVEQALGVAGAEAARLLTPAAAQAGEARPAPSFEVGALRALADRTWPEVRARVRELLADPRFRYVDERDTGAYRAKVLEWLKVLGAQGIGRMALVDEPGHKADLGAFIAAFETLATFDLSLVVKAGVQFGLFGGSIYFLGTERHHALLPKVASVELPGCFAMSELGHGSNVRDLETVARYDAATGEFVLHTPSDSARKEWLGNAALHGRMATVFAQLEVGGERHGVHALLVPLRDEAGRLLPGVRIEDCGVKMGLNGVDNGRIWFDGVRVPRENLLDRFAQVSPEGVYSSSIPSASKRFFTMLGTLVAGRVSVACAGLSATKSGLAIAIRYAETRRQFGPPGKPEVKLLDYQTHQRRLLVPLARAWALHFALEHLVARYLARTEEQAQEIEALAAGLKAYSTWNTTATLQVAREACGGQGYLAANRLPSLKADTDVFTTFEGDNTVLMQLVAKALLTDYRQRFEDDRVFAVMRLVLDKASTLLVEQNPLAVRRVASEHLRDGEFLLRALRFREEDLLASVARRLRKRLGSGMDSFEAFNACQDHLLSLAHAHVERVVHEQFLAGVRGVQDEALRRVLEKLSDLYALSCLEAASGWFQEHGHLEASKAKAIRKEVLKLCAELRPEALGLVEGFGIPEACLAAPIAFGQAPR